MKLTSGAILGDYRIVRELGSGGMAAVYLASHLTDPVRKEVALKILLPAMGNREDLVLRFQREAEISGRLRHHRIARALEFVQTDQHVFLVLEYMPGGTLADRINRHGSLPWLDAVRILRQVGEALAYAHKQGIVHRDVKPSNILFDAEDNAYLTDFGVAHDVDAKSLTASGFQPGTFHYMSPEQIRGRPVDERTDQFALATVFYQMISGVLPFSATDSAALTYQIVHEEPAPLPTGLEAPYAVSAILRRAHKKEAKQRYPSVLDMIHAVEELAGTQPDGVRVRPRRRDPAWLRPVAFTGALTLVVAVAVVSLVNAFLGEVPPVPVITMRTPTAHSTNQPVATATPSPTPEVEAATATPTVAGGVIVTGGPAVIVQETAVVEPTPDLATPEQSPGPPTLVPTNPPVLTETPTPTATRPSPTPTTVAVTNTPTRPPARPLAVSLAQPEAGAALSGQVTFSWSSLPGLADNEAYELVFWREGQDAMRDGMGPAGAGREPARTINLNAPPPWLQSGDWAWGVLLVNPEPSYRRIASLAPGRRFTYQAPAGEPPTATPPCHPLDPDC